jgi:hypothetical protein
MQETLSMDQIRKLQARAEKRIYDILMELNEDIEQSELKVIGVSMVRVEEETGCGVLVSGRVGITISI